MSAIRTLPTILVLGGTGEANKLVAALQETTGLYCKLILSLAGRTSNPNLPDHCHIHMGGFGGKQGFENYLQAEEIDIVIDATHPYAAQMTHHAYDVCQRLQIPLCRLERPKWQQQNGDNWHLVPDIESAVKLAPELGRNIFVTTGSKDLTKFTSLQKVTLFARMIEKPEKLYLPDNIKPIMARGPFDAATEKAFVKSHNIDLIISKNSGGASTYAKLVVARDENIPVIMVERPLLPPIYSFDTISKIINWLTDKI